MPSAPSTPSVFLRCDCPYTYHHLNTAFMKRPYTLLPPSASPSSILSAAIWCDEYESLDWGAVLGPPYRICSNFCIRKGLGRKSNLASTLSHYLARHPESPLAASFPPTQILDVYSAFHARPRWLDARSALTEALFEAEEAMERAGPGVPWILKPSLTNKGAGIVIVHSMEEVEACVVEEQEVGQWVLQRYVNNTLLLPLPTGGSHKFHVRLYCAAIGALEVHVFREALLLLAPSLYTPDDTGDTSAHITNTCVSTASPHFHEDLHVRCLSELGSILSGGGNVDVDGIQGRVKKLYADMCTVVAHCFAAQEGKAAGYQPLPLSWELYGVDFLVGEDWVPILLEFNPTPDVRQTGDRLDGIIGTLFEGLLTLALDTRRVPEGGEEGGLTVNPGGGGLPVSINTEPRVPVGGCQSNGVVNNIPPWAPGSSGAPLPFTLPPGSGASQGQSQGDSNTGWDCVYSKKWAAAHNATVRIT